MKRILPLLFFLTLTSVFAQVGVNTTNPDPSSMLDISATNKGVLVPRVSLPNVTTTQLDGTNTAATGLLIWNTNAATTGGNGVGFYFFNGTQWMPITQSGSADHDIYEVGSTNPPNSITDNKFTEGSLAIGSNTAATGVLDVDNPTKTTSVDVTNTYVINPIGIDVSLTSANSAKTGVKTTFNGASATGNNTFISNIDNTTGNNNRNGILQEFNGTSSSIATTIRGVKNDFKSTASYYAVIYGFENSFADNTNSFKYGLTNNFLNGGSSQSTGVLNNFNGISTGTAYGVYNSSNNYNGQLNGVFNIFSGTGNSEHSGVDNFLNGTGTGTHYGVRNNLNGTGTGDKYGIYNFIPITAGGTHYGIYSNVQKSGSFAGYFQGNVSIGTTTTNNYILPTSRGTNGQIMQTDAAGNVSWVTPVTPSSDHDWYETGTTTAPNAITDNKFTQGRVTIGSSTLTTTPLDIYNSTLTNSMFVENSSALTSTTSAGLFSNTGTGANTRYGLQTQVSGSGSGNRINLFNSNSAANTGGWQVGNYNFITGSGADFVYGIRNDISATGTSFQNQNGVYNNFSTVSDSNINGIYNFISSNGGGDHNGIQNRFLGSGNGQKFGVYNYIAGTGSGARYGNYNYISSSGTGAKYGTYTLVDPTAGGTHYGTYSEALKIGSYAGYFLGNVSIGTTTSNNYILPPSRGTNGQIMQTDGSGNVSWVTPTVVTDTDDQGTDVFSLTGTTLNLSLQNDGVATQTVDLSSLKDADWFEVGGITQPDAITDNKYTFGDISIGKSTAATAKLDVDAVVKNTTLSLSNSNATAGTKWGILNNLIVDTTNPNSAAIANNVSGNANFKYGIYNTLLGATTGANFEYGMVNNHNSSGNVSGFGVFNSFNPTATNTGNYTGLYNEDTNTNHTGGFVGVNNVSGTTTSSTVYGISNNISGSGSGVRAGVYNNMGGNSSGEVIGTETYMMALGTGNKYGERITILNTTPGTHYGVYSDVTKAGSFAGYFLGNVSVGSNITNNYILPPSRGTNGQIMQTDGSGNVTWVTPTVVTDTDDQGTDVFSLTGNTLNLSLQNDGVATQTVDLSSLAGDDDWTDVGADIERQTGNVYIGDTSATNNNLYISNQIIDWDNVAYSIDPNGDSIMNEILFDDGSVADPSIRFSDINTGFFSPISATTAYSANGLEAFRIHPSGDIAIGQTIDPDFKLSTSSSSGNSNVRIGNNNINDNVIEVDHSGQLGNGLEVNMNSIYTLASRSAISANSTGRVINVDLSRYETGSSNLFGVKSIVTDDITGVEYGVYSEALQANGFAGYFLGRMSIGTTTANNYILPSSRGTNGQIMQTNATGAVSWVNPTTIDTDNQTIDVLSLTGNTLNISLQDDAVATQTVDLSSLSNDWKLTGNAGTVSGINFIGTTDAQDLDFRTNNITKLTLTQRGQLSITNTGGSVLVGSGAGDADDFTLNQNTFIGTVSGESTSTGNLNSALGYNSLNANTLGLGNTAVGSNALNVNVDGNNNTGLGRGANVSTTNLTNATAVGFNSTVNASNKIRLGNATITVVEGQVAYTNPSDARFKFNVQENVPGLDFIKKLKPVTYNFDTKKFDEHLNKNRNRDEVASEDFSKSTAIIRTGFLAQDVEKICTDLGYNFDGLHIPDANNPTDNYGIAYSQFIMPIVKAVQEQQAIIETQKNELEQLKSELEKYKQLEERIKALEQK